MIFPLIGNETIKKSVLNSINSKRIPHALIIEGESGSGKTVLSKFIAKAVLCQSENAPCLSCKNCHLAEVGSHPDLFTVAPAEKKKNITVDQVRELRLQSFKKPQMSESMVFIIDKAETLNQQAQNTLLKILEEPPGSTVFIFLTENLSALLNTVVSRCVVYSISPTNINDAATYLQTQKGIDKETALSASESCHGNIGRALNLLDNTTQDVIKADAKEYFNAVLKSDTYKMLAITADYEKDRVGTEAFISELRLLLMNELKSNINDNLKTNKLLKLIDITDSLKEPLKTNINLSLLFTSAAYRYSN